MPLLELKCTRCGFVNEELVKADGNYPPCPHCGGKTEQVYSGKLIVNCAKRSIATVIARIAGVAVNEPQILQFGKRQQRKLLVPLFGKHYGNHRCGH